MAEKCSKCGNIPTENEKGRLCPVCGDYFCYDCAKEPINKEGSDCNSKDKICPVCDVFLNFFA